jgi:hypothetical protein
VETEHDIPYKMAANKTQLLYLWALKRTNQPASYGEIRDLKTVHRVSRTGLKQNLFEKELGLNEYTYLSKIFCDPGIQGKN